MREQIEQMVEMEREKNKLMMEREMAEEAMEN